MSRPDSRHPSDARLLPYLDGELGLWKRRQVRRHLEGCGQCRAEAAELRDVLTDLVRHRKDMLGSVPPPPEPWADLTGDFERIDAELAGRSWAARLFSGPALRWCATTAVAAALIFAIIYQFRETPSVQAARLLEKATAAADARPKRVRRVRITTSSRQIVREIGGGTDSAVPAMEALFRSAKYPWDDPLSAHAFQQWRESLSEKRDEVATLAGDECYRISTATTEGALASATLTFRMSDMEPTWGRFEFRGREWVEMTALPDAAPAPAVETNVGVMPPEPGPPAPPEVTDAAGPATPIAGLGDELRVVAALHGVGADLGDPLEITRSGGVVIVTGTAIPPARQRQIERALQATPGVEVRFSGSADTSSPAASASPAKGDRQQRLNAQALDLMDAAMSRAYALRRLARQFPAGSEPQLNLAERRTLRELAREHLTALEDGLRELRGRLGPMLRPEGAAEPLPDHVAWQPAAEDVLRAAQRVERGVASLLGMAPVEPGAGANAPARVAAALSDLQAGIEHCRRHLSYDDVEQRK